MLSKTARISSVASSKLLEKDGWLETVELQTVK